MTESSKEEGVILALIERFEKQRLPRLTAQSTENPDQLDLEAAIEMMERAQEIQLPF